MRFAPPFRPFGAVQDPEKRLNGTPPPVGIEERKNDNGPE